jgi:DNA-binding NarL/FixJ family response regulator
MRDTMRSLLTLHGDIEVIGEAVNGNEAIQMVAACRPDVILMDLNMPKRNGIEAAQEIKKAWKEAVIIGVCAVRDKYIVDTFLKAGAKAVISKDSFVQELYSTIQEACDKKLSLPDQPHIPT